MPKPKRTALLDLVVPIPLSNAALAVNGIESIAKNTDVPCNFVIMLDGGVRADYEDLETYLAGFDRPWKLMHNNPAVGLSQTIREGLAECNEKITAIIGPQVRIEDPQWFVKIKQIFDRDPITGCIDTWPNALSRTAYPIKRAHNRHPLPGCRFLIVQTAFAKKTFLANGVDPAEFWSTKLSGQGGSSWHAPSIRYTEVEHEDHELLAVPLGTRR